MTDVLNGNGNSDSQLQKAIDDFKSDPLKEWQFPLSGKDLSTPLQPERVEQNLKEFHQWFYDEDDAVLETNVWVDLDLG